MATNMLKIDRSALVTALRNLETIVVSLDRLGSCATEMNEEEYKESLVAFLADWDVFAKLSEARRLLSEPFETELGNDGMDELERELEGITFWHRDAPHDSG